MSDTKITSAVELASAVNGSVLPPSDEELISQRLVFRKLVSEGFGPHKSMVVSTALFTFSDWNLILSGHPFYPISATLLGAVNCYLYFYTKLTYPILFHMRGEPSLGEGEIDGPRRLRENAALPLARNSQYTKMFLGLFAFY